jgi:hypothetical protein
MKTLDQKIKLALKKTSKNTFFPIILRNTYCFIYPF